MQEVIFKAAIRKDGVIYTGYRHHLIGQDMLKQGVCSRPFPGGEDQAFVTNLGRWVSREEALKIALNAGQLNIKNKHGSLTQLFSEDLWTVNGEPYYTDNKLFTN